MLEIETNEQMNDFDQAYAAGYLEGATTRDLISLHLQNTIGNFCDDSSTTCSKLIDFLQTNFKWLYKQINQHTDDPYWHHVK